jgi:hypothetical protein
LRANFNNYRERGVLLEQNKFYTNNKIIASNQKPNSTGNPQLEREDRKDPKRSKRLGVNLIEGPKETNNFSPNLSKKSKI